MRSVGLFEAKTKLSEICADVAERQEPVVVTRRGKPWVRIEPIPEARRMTVMESRAEYLAGERTTVRRREPEFEVPARSKSLPRKADLDG